MEKNIMSDTKSHYDIEICFRVVEDFCLHDRITYIRTLCDMLFWDIDIRFWDRSHFTAGGKYLKTVLSQIRVRV